MYKHKILFYIMSENSLMWKRCVGFEHLTPYTGQSKELMLHTSKKLCHRVGNAQIEGRTILRLETKKMSVKIQFMSPSNLNGVLKYNLSSLLCLNRQAIKASHVSTSSCSGNTYNPVDFFKFNLLLHIIEKLVTFTITKKFRFL